MRSDFFSTIVEIIKYGGSTFAALVAMSIYTTTDGFFIGNWVGTAGLEAMALVYPVTMVFIALGTLFETGGSAVVAEKIGANKKILAEKIMRSNYLCAFAIGIFFAIIGNIFSRIAAAYAESFYLLANLLLCYRFQLILPSREADFLPIIKYNTKGDSLLLYREVDRLAFHDSIFE